MWYLPGPGIEPMSPALAGGFFTTEPPGKPFCPFFDWVIFFFIVLHESLTMFKIIPHAFWELRAERALGHINLETKPGSPHKRSCRCCRREMLQGFVVGRNY